MSGRLCDPPRQQLAGGQTGDLLHLVVEDGDHAVSIRRDHAGGEVLQERLVVDFCVLHFGKELRVLDRDRELPAKNAERALLDGAVDAARASRDPAASRRQVDHGRKFPSQPPIWSDLICRLTRSSSGVERTR